MARWTCPRCEREFGRAHQAHVCVPGITVADVFAGRPPVLSRDRTVHTVRLTSPDQVDDMVRAWLTEAYVSAGPG